MTLLLVAIGGFFGAICRYSIGRAFKKKSDIPNHTLVINVSGSLLLGIIAGLHVTEVVSDGFWHLFGVGFLGAYTTMSTFGYETFNLIKDKRIGEAVYYVIASFTLGIFAMFIGLKLMLH